MRDGQIEQVGSPEEIYEAPSTRWVASFVGETEAVPGTVAGDVVSCELGRFSAHDAAPGEVEVVFRPEAVAIGLTSPREDAARAVVEARRFYGHDQLVELRLASGVLIHSRRLGFPAWHPGDHVRVWIEGPVTTVAAATA
jgi:ABC-type Fe3+/spermidine/putrescine transport system ATPase subunit